MPTSEAIEALPLWSLFIAVLFVVLLSVEAGHRLGLRRGNRWPEGKEAPVGAMAGTTLGLLAFLLAFTFGSAAGRYDTRRQLVVDEANAIGTAYLRAAMLPDRRDEIRTLLRDYVDVRLQAVQSGSVAEGIRRSEQLHEQLWARAAAIAQTNPTPIVGLYVSALNEVIDLHSKRLHAGLRDRIPPTIWLALLAITVASFGTMGYHAGLSRMTRSLAELAVAFTFSVVIGLIADLDRPAQGLLETSQQALVELRQSMQAP